MAKISMFQSSLTILVLLLANAKAAEDQLPATFPSHEIRQFFPVNLDKRESRAVGNPNTTVFYNLYTKKNPNTAQLLQLGSVPSIINSNFNPNWPVKMFHGGWSGGCPWTFRADYLKRGDYNYIDVCWQTITNDAADTYNGVREAGRNTARLIKFLMDVTKVPLSSFHIIGHSAGAHAAGGVGFGFNELFQNTIKLPRITGLDPSSYWDPDTLSKNDYLDASDANFVDIIHSDGTPVFYGAGINRQLGHADFYPNNGCCDHLAAFYYFQESINTKTGFFSVHCSTYSAYTAGQCAGKNIQFMGEDVNRNASGIYFLSLNGGSPWAKGPGSLGTLIP